LVGAVLHDGDMDGLDPIDDADRCYRAVRSRDARFDGVFYTGVVTTGIYCRPSCPAVTPRRRNVRFYPSAAAAQRAGFRACRRCRPDTVPGSPLWDVKGDVVGRAMRLIADGVVDREGVEGLAARTGYTSRHLGRVLQDRVGAGPLALARSQRAQTARLLIETTPMAFGDVAFAAGFSSIRQFNETIRHVFGTTPSGLRDRRHGRGTAAHDATGAPAVTVRLAVRQPFDAARVLGFLAPREVEGIERVEPDAYHRTLSLPHGPGLLTARPRPDRAEATFRLSDLRDLGTAVERCRRLLDLDADPAAIDDQLIASPVLAPLVGRRPGLRVPGHVDGFEVLVRAVVGQQVSVAGARTILGGLVERYGRPMPVPDGSLDRLFPTPDTLAAVDPESLPMPRSRGRSLVGAAAAVADGRLVLDRGADRTAVRSALLALPGIGPWTADYVAMRALGDPDVWLGADLGVVHALRSLGRDRLDESAVESLRPWRSYAVMHLWNHLYDPIAEQPR
jgi:AraC family transcriptional regulator, regulatory protein of adaptative response / DNA-3-methyladenine glycosylase II